MFKLAIIVGVLALIASNAAEDPSEKLIKLFHIALTSDDLERINETSHRTIWIEAPLQPRPDELISRYNYKGETHAVTTSDGYVITLHRITGNSNNPYPKGKPAVLLQHGLLGVSINWIKTGPQRSLAFILADRGFDVWLGNARGNVYSRNHRTLKSTDNKYWDYSWHEIGVFDLPATIDYILKETGNRKITYVGYSQGTTISYVLLSERPEYNEKISAIFSLAPISFFSNVNPVLKFIAEITYLAYNSYPSLVKHFLGDISTKQLLHYGQLINSGRFCKYDYGPAWNQKIYNSVQPPDYKLKNIKVPTTIFYAFNDLLVAPRDAITLYNKLPKPNGLYYVNHANFRHTDFVSGNDVKRLVYDKLVSLILQYHN